MSTVSQKPARLDRLPFRLRPDPDFLHLTGLRASLYASLRSTAHDRPRTTTLCGADGVGKTTFLMALARERDTSYRIAWITQQDLTVAELLDALGAQFGLSASDGDHVSPRALTRHFAAEHNLGRTCAVFVDDAQHVPEDTLRELTKLCERQPGPFLLLAGTPALERRLRALGIRFLSHAIARFNKEEIPGYIRHRVKVAGLADAQLPPEDVAAEVFRYTGGTPKLMNIICDRAMALAKSHIGEALSAGGIRDAAAAMQWIEFVSKDDSQATAEDVAPESHALDFELEIRRDGRLVSRLPLRRGRSVVGRAQEADICLPSMFVSRQHCRFVATDKACFVEDLSSTNGILVNGRRHHASKLKPGDVVTVGDHQIECTLNP
jgi:type II secretory pathway predicted ATPase ExeA